jgi:hypothetical protein
MSFYSIVETRGTGGTLELTVPPYLSKFHIHVYLDGFVYPTFEWINSNTIRLTAPNGALVRVVRRTSPGVRLTRYQDGTSLKPQILENDSLQAFYLAQEAYDWASIVSAGGQNLGGEPGGTGEGSGELTVDTLLTLLNGQITSSQLFHDLGARIDLIDGPDTVPGTAAWRVAQEATARVAAVQAEADARVAGLAAEASARGAAITLEQSVRQAADDSLASSITTLTAAVNANTAAIQDEQTARVNADSAEATSRTILEAQMRGSYTGNDINSVTTGLLYQERIARANQDTALAQQIVLLSAGVGEQFDYKYLWYFDGSTDGWGGNGAPVSVNGFLRPANHATDPYVTSPAGLPIDGSKYSQARFRIRKVGSPTWEGYLWWQKNGDTTWDAGQRVSLTEPTYDANGIGVITANPSWNVTLDHIRVDLGSNQSSTDYFELDWAAIGRPSPGASSAALLDEQTARAAADSAEAASRQALSATLTGMTDPTGASLGSLTSGLLYDEKTARVSADSAMSTSISTLQATVTNNYNTLNAAVTNVDTARVNGDNALASSISTLQTTVNGHTSAIQTEATTRANETGALFGKYTVKIDLNGYVTGYGLMSTDNTAGPSSSFAVRADQFYIASPSGPGIPTKTPFIVQTTDSYVDGVWVPAGVYVDGLAVNRIRADRIDTRGLSIKASDGTVIFSAGTGLDISLLNGRGAFATLNTITAGNVTSYIANGAIGNAQIGGDIYSTNFAYGSAGWIIRRDGYAEFSNVKVRGDIQATSVTANIVNTSAIVANAVSNSSGAYTEALVGTGVGSLIQEATLSGSTGAPVLVIANALFGGTGSGTTNKVALQILRNGTAIWSGSFPASPMGSGSSYGGTVSIMMVDAGATGTVTYQLVRGVATGISSVSFTNRSVVAIELKR